jgi:hypothetical protein
MGNAYHQKNHATLVVPITPLSHTVHKFSNNLIKLFLDNAYNEHKLEHFHVSTTHNFGEEFGNISVCVCVCACMIERESTEAAK